MRLLEEALRNTLVPHELHITRDGEDALDFLARHGRYGNAPRPSLVLLDLNLPTKGGHEVLGELKRDDRLRSIPVIILSSSGRADDVGRAYQLYANCYIQKPADLESFFQVMRVVENFWMRVAELTPAESTGTRVPGER